MKLFTMQTENDVIDIRKLWPTDVRILGKEYKEKDFTGKDVCNQRGIELYFNTRDPDPYYRFKKESM